jgi:hypothetical protein
VTESEMAIHRWLYRFAGCIGVIAAGLSFEGLTKNNTAYGIMIACFTGTWWRVCDRIWPKGTR